MGVLAKITLLMMLKGSPSLAEAMARNQFLEEVQINLHLLVIKTETMISPGQFPIKTKRKQEVSMQITMIRLASYIVYIQMELDQTRT